MSNFLQFPLHTAVTGKYSSIYFQLYCECPVFHVSASLDIMNFHSPCTAPMAIDRIVVIVNIDGITCFYNLA